MKSYICLTLVFLLSFSTNAYSNQCRLVLSDGFTSDALKNSNLPAVATMGVPVSQSYGDMVSDLLINNNVVTNKLFLASLLQVVGGRGHMDLAPKFYQNGRLNISDYNLSDLESVLESFSTTELTEIAVEVLSGVHEALVRYQMVQGDSIAPVSKDLMVLTQSYLRLYAGQADDLAGLLSELLKTNYVQLVRLRNKRVITDVETEVNLRLRRDALGETHYFFGFFGALASGTVALASGAVVMGSLEAWALAGLGAGVTGLISKYKIKNMVRRGVLKDVEQLAVDADQVNQIAAKTLLSSGLIEGTVVENSGLVLSTHPALEPDGRVIQITSTEPIDQLLGLLESEGGAESVSLPDNIRMVDFLTFGKPADDKTVAVSKLLFGRSKDFLKLIEDLPVRIDEFNSMVKGLSDGSIERTEENVASLQDLAEDFVPVKGNIEKIIGLFEYLTNYTDEVTDLYSRYISFLEEFDKSSLNDRLLRVFEDRLEQLKNSLEVTKGISLGYQKLLDHAVVTHGHLEGTRLMLVSVQNFISSGFNDGVVRDYLDNLNKLSGVFSEMAEELRVEEASREPLPEGD